MVQTLELKRSNLVLPTSGREIDREEMCYIEGGVYLDNSACQIITMATAFLAWIGVGALAVASYLGWSIGTVAAAVASGLKGLIVKGASL
ncbi:MAG: hypothetical protein LBT20_04365, partial [Clostridiales bacterium]|nr:hypothetical protein [Clostridiales bacterium]